MTANHSSKIVIVTALPLEFQAVQKFLSNPQKEGQSWIKGNYMTPNGINHEILLVESGAGNVRAGIETTRALEHFQPSFTFFVGIAGGLKDVVIGDVVASTKVIGIEVGKASPEGFKPRSDTMAASYLLEQIARYVSRDGQWVEKRTEKGNFPNPNSFVHPIVAAEKVVASKDSEEYARIKEYCSDALAIAMEDNGFLAAARVKNIHALAIRGISDLIEGKSKADEGGSQPWAAANAVAFLFGVIDELETPAQKHLRKDVRDQKVKNKLVKILVEYYEKGPEDKNIWERAGGDISIFSNHDSRREQWYSAVKELSKGGGGENITLESLISEIGEDYRNANILDKLFKD